MTVHGHVHSHQRAREGNRRGLTIALFITASIMVLEFAGGLLTNSLALLSDAGHMLSDTGSLLLSLGAIWLARRPPSPRKTYGYYRFEILAALLNGVTLFVISALILREAYQRFQQPPPVASGYMIAVAAFGLVANLGSILALRSQGDVHDNVNVRGAYLHVIGDTLGSVGAILAGVLMLLFGWYIADPIISAVVAFLILRSAWGIVDRAIHILLEGTPETVDFEEARQVLTALPGVLDVHDLHLWTITSGLDSLSCHLVVEDEADSQVILQEAIDAAARRFGIEHTTIQVEKSELRHVRLDV